MTDIQQNTRSEQQLAELEENNQVTIISRSLDGTSLDDFNEALNVELNRKKVALNRFWITQETLDQLQNTSQSVQRNFDQGKQKSSF